VGALDIRYADRTGCGDGRWGGPLGAAGAEHVMARFQMGRSRAYHRLSGLVRDGLLEHKQLLYRWPGLYVATVEGLRWSGLQRLGVHP
jgi:hypothetical protein